MSMFALELIQVFFIIIPDPTVQAPIVHPDSRCDSPFEYLRGACFAVIPVTPQTTGTDGACNELQPGSRLATITSLYENVFVRLQISKLQHNVPTSTVRAKIGGKLSSIGRLSWISQCYPSFNHISSFTASSSGADLCILMQYDGSWVTTECVSTAFHYLVCEKRKGEARDSLAETIATNMSLITRKLITTDLSLRTVKSLLIKCSKVESSKRHRNSNASIEKQERCTFCVFL